MLFLGRGVSGGEEVPRGSEERTRAERLLGDGVEGHGWAEQVHSATVLEGRPGPCGQGDALVTGKTGLALSVVTADCVPVLLATGEQVAAVHAGWRGVVAGVVEATVERLVAAGAPAPGSWCAWIGPAIGGCCYEVGYEVAERVVAASVQGVRLAGTGERPHLDLPGAILAQLSAAGVGTVRPLLWCTRCEEERLYSYRREGAGGGRNRSLVWMPAAGGG